MLIRLFLLKLEVISAMKQHQFNLFTEMDHIYYIVFISIT